jgi:hypothetical protein
MSKSNLKSQRIDRRKFIALGAASLGATVLRPVAARELGDPRRTYGDRSPFEKAVRTFVRPARPAPVQAERRCRTSMERSRHRRCILSDITPVFPKSIRTRTSYWWMAWSSDRSFSQ